jgi:hypothetical protein
MESDHGNNADDSTESQQQQAPSSQAGRPPPVVLTSQVNLIQLQRQLKGLLKGSFEFCSTRNGTRVVTKEMADFSTVRCDFESKILPYFIVYPKSQKPIKAEIRHLPFTAPTEDISVGFWTLSLTLLASIKCHPTAEHLQKEQ